MEMSEVDGAHPYPNFDLLTSWMAPGPTQDTQRNQQPRHHDGNSAISSVFIFLAPIGVASSLTAPTM